MDAFARQPAVERERQVRAIAEALAFAGVELLCLDWDQTVIFCRSQSWEGTAEMLAKAVRPFFKSLIRAAVLSGLKVGIVTFNDKTPLIAATLAVALPDVPPHTYVVRGHPGAADPHAGGNWQRGMTAGCIAAVFPPRDGAGPASEFKCGQDQPDRDGRVRDPSVSALGVVRESNNRDASSCASLPPPHASMMSSVPEAARRGTGSALCIVDEDAGLGKLPHMLAVERRFREGPSLDAPPHLSRPSTSAKHASPSRGAVSEGIQAMRSPPATLDASGVPALGLQLPGGGSTGTKAATGPESRGAPLLSNDKENRGNAASASAGIQNGTSVVMRFDASKGYPRQAFEARARAKVGGSGSCQNRPPLKPWQIVLIDDDRKNVQIAQERGVHAFCLQLDLPRPLVCPALMVALQEWSDLLTDR
jgi:hypothetical protein